MSCTVLIGAVKSAAASAVSGVGVSVSVVMGLFYKMEWILASRRRKKNSGPAAFGGRGTGVSLLPCGKSWLALIHHAGGGAGCAVEQTRRIGRCRVLDHGTAVAIAVYRNVGCILALNRCATGGGVAGCAFIVARWGQIVCVFVAACANRDSGHAQHHQADLGHNGLLALQQTNRLKSVKFLLYYIVRLVAQHRVEIVGDGFCIGARGPNIFTPYQAGFTTCLFMWLCWFSRF